MSKDIRSFFTVSSKKPATAAPPKREESSTTKRKAVQILSDEDEVPNTPKIEKTRNTKKKRRILDSDDDDGESENNKSKLNQKKKLKKVTPKKVVVEKKPVDVSKLFGNEPKRVERKKPTKIQTDESLIISDDDFDMSIIEIDETKLVGNDKKSSNQKVSTKTPEKSKDTEKKLTKSSSSKDVKTPQKSEPLKKPETPKVSKESREEIVPERSPELNRSLNETRSGRKPNLNSSNLTDEERHERKRLTAILYQKYKNRQSVINPGSKEIPKGKPNCLRGLTFLVTGVLESLLREEAETLVKDLGGKISTTVGKRLNYMIVGEEAGPKKLATAEEFGVKMISEDELLDLIRKKSNLQKETNGNRQEVESVKDEKKTPIKSEKKTPIKDEKKTQITEEKKSPNKEEKKTPIKQEKKSSNKQEKKTPIKTEKKTPLKIEKKSSPKRKTDEDRPGHEIKRLKTEVSNEKEIKNDKLEKIKPVLSEKECENLPWVDKYKPTSIKEIIGQQGAASNCVKLTKWLSNWHSNHDGKKKLQKPNPWAKNDDGSYYKAALLSGPPGIGKTTTANLVCKELGFDTVEFNASDTRSKKLLQQEVSELLSNKSLFGYFHGAKEALTKKHVLLMDEVDGMAGNEDRGGIQELITLIKDSSIPIICMCNDRNHQKMRSLVNYCYDLRFNKPRLEQIKSAVMSICYKEKLKLPAKKIEEIISATNNDIRQTINHISLLSAGKDLNLTETNENTARKDLKLGPWDVVRKVFNVDDHKNMSINDKTDLFFNDYSLGPLFVQQNYLSVNPKVPKNQIIQQVALAADSLSLGDLIDKRIRSQSAWTLLPVQAMFSSVMPGEYMAGHFTGQIMFPSWLGKNSKTQKRKRLAQEIHDHTRIRTSGSRLSIRLDYAQFLLNAIVRPLKEHGVDGVPESLNVIKEYRLLREDLDSLVELTIWPKKKNVMETIDGKVKAALTRAYNKEVLAYTYSVGAGIKKKKADKEENDLELELNYDENVENISDQENGDDDDKLENDALIKAKKKPTTKISATKSEKKMASTSSKSKAGKSKK